MKHFRFLWKLHPEYDEYLIQNKATKPAVLYPQFCAKFPEADVTFDGFMQRRTDLHANLNTRPSHSTKEKPLWSEQNKKGSIRIKTPEGWVLKAKWVYEQTTGEKIPANYAVVHLDLDYKNNQFENLFPVPRRVMSVINMKYTLEKGKPEQNKIKILQAMLYQKMLDAGEKNGMVQVMNGRRIFKKDAQIYFHRPEYLQKVKERYQRMRNDPEKYAAYLEKQKINHRRRRARAKAEKRETD